MSSNPPTRRSRRSSNGEPSLPIIPILIGVIVLGFVIGAGLSLAGRHDTVVALASPSASAATATFAPVTPAPTEKPTSIPAPAHDATGAPSASAASVTTAAASGSTPHAKATQRAATATVAARVTLTPAAVTVSRAPLAAAPEAPAAANPAASSATAKSASAAAAAGTAAPASNVVEADSAFARLSAAVVRQYLEAVKRGDEDGAYAALGASPGSKGVSLTEMGVVDSQTHVGRIDAHTAANDDALVSVQLQTQTGPYFGQYTVHKTDTGAAVIVAHSIVKP